MNRATLMPSEVTAARAAALRDQVLKTWSPPRQFGGESLHDVAQTAVMQTLAFVMGREFMNVDSMSDNQRLAIDQGLTLMHAALIEQL